MDLSDISVERRLFMPAGIFFVIAGGWLLSRWTYCSVVFGFIYGWNVFWVRLSVISRKFTVCLFASIVILSPLFLNTRQISFLIYSLCCPSVACCKIVKI